MEKLGSILVVDDDDDVLRAARLMLKRHFAAVALENDPLRIPERMKREQYDLILLDMNFTEDTSSGKEGLFWLRQIQKINKQVAVVMITAYGEIDLAVEAMKAGATDFVTKPWDNVKLVETLKAAFLPVQKDAAALTGTETSQQGFQDIIGQSSVMLQLYDQIKRIADTDASVLILGENGTGKELVAKAIHQTSQRSKKPFVQVDMGALSEHLFESELFGHVKGAFTDAKTDRKGRFEAASGGTLFLDEIGNLSLSMQQKLLSAIQQQAVTRVGANRPISVDIRLIGATNADVEKMVQTQTFRQDLLYRINTIVLTIPPLRDRKGDIPLLARHFLAFYAQKYQRNLGSLSNTVLDSLQGYDWPGNVRELQHAMEKGVIMSQAGELEIAYLLPTYTPSTSSQADGSSLEGMSLETAEKLLISKALKKHKGNISQTAQELGITRSSLYRRLEKYDL